MQSRKAFSAEKISLSQRFSAGSFSLTLRNISDPKTVIVTELGEPGRTACRVFCCADRSRVESSSDVQDKPCNFGRSKWHRDRSQATCRAAGYPSVIAMIASFRASWFSRRVRVLWGLLARVPVFTCNNRCGCTPERQIGSSVLCTGVIAEG